MSAALKLRDLERLDPPADLPFIAADEYALLWIGNFWDGPISGMLAWAGRQFWFERFRENEDDHSLNQWFRRYAVVELTAGQLAKEHEVHQAFQRHVGTHWDVESPGTVHPSDQHHHFYDKYLEYCRTRHYDDNRVVAWFQR